MSKAFYREIGLTIDQVQDYDIAPGGSLPSISCPIATSIAADAWALQKVGTMSKGKTILWAWMSRGLLAPELAAQWHFNGDMTQLEEHMKSVRGAYRDLLSMKSIPSLDGSLSTCWIVL